MSKSMIKILSFFLAFCMIFSMAACSGENSSAEEEGATSGNPSANENSNPQGGNPVNLGNQGSVLSPAPKGEYNPGVVLVKFQDQFDAAALGQLQYASVEPLYEGSSWYSVALNDAEKTEESVSYLAELGKLAGVDYDYVMNVTADVSNVDVSGNPDHDKEVHQDTHSVSEAWAYLEANGVNAGGSPDVIVAVIDTGVDYNHLDLRNNIWTNSAEIPDNGIDDDGNGYIDDVLGWDCVGDDNDPMDDNGHGTHVAGIIAAENNDIGGVGIAFNCKIMVIKAGNSSGYFNNSDIAEAIRYAYMNGASVINMSFAGTYISVVVEEALEEAYFSCVLVAAAGNEALCNNLLCAEHYPLVNVFYPAALPYVIGVMSTTSSGNVRSSFSNFDHYPYGDVEYEVYAVGEAVYSTWPGNKYTFLNGTSMATPCVSAIAALLRSAYPDREVYSNKYIHSQIVNTGTYSPDGIYTLTNAYEALSRTPSPSVNLYDFYIFDNVEFSEKNDGDGIIDAGETIRLAVELQNRGGVASDVTATIDTFRSGETILFDPYFEFVRDEISLSDIGTYSVRGSDLIYTDGVVTGSEIYFEIVVSEDCPNDYLCEFNINISYTNGMSAEDMNQYTTVNHFMLSVTNGVVLDYFYAKDTTLPGNRRYIVSHDVIVAEGAVLTFEAGAIIQFYEGDTGYYDTNYSTPTIKGNVILNGTQDNMIDVYTSELYATFFGQIFATEDSQFIYTNFVNISMSNGNLINCTMAYTTDNDGNFSEFANGSVNTHPVSSIRLENVNVKNSIIDASNVFIFTNFAINNFESSVLVFPSTLYYGRYITNATDSVFVSHKSKLEHAEESYYTGNVDNIIIYNATNNVFLQDTSSNRLKDYTILSFVNFEQCTGNQFHGMYYTHPELLLENIFDEEGHLKIDVNDATGQDISKIYPYISNIHIENMDGETITTCGTERVRFVVDFNRDMDITADTKLFFGSVAPYADYEIEGEWLSSRQWVGEYILKATIENGTQRFRFENAWTTDGGLECFNNASAYLFNIDTSSAVSMNLQAVPAQEGIQLTWFQDDYDTLLGYNIYRAEEKDGNYVKLNPAILLPSDESFLDENAEPGKTYWYTYTVVLTDFAESTPAGKVMATATDTIQPNLYHTPVNQGYLNNNLVISCTASDNVAVSSVVLYYRTTGTNQWKSLTMSKQNDKFSATIFGSELAKDGMEYYIVASDGVNTIAKGSAEVPYTVVIKDASAISRIGDVDGDGTVTTKDALMIMQCINGDFIMSDDEFKRADLNKDGELSSVEALRILQYINGNVSSLDM